MKPKSGKKEIIEYQDLLTTHGYNLTYSIAVVDIDSVLTMR